MEIRRIELVPRTLEAVRFEGNAQERQAVQQWVNDRTNEGQAVMGENALYIQGFEGTEKVEVGQWVLFDVTDKVFTSATDGAVQAFYRDVE